MMKAQNRFFTPICLACLQLLLCLCLQSQILAATPEARIQQIGQALDNADETAFLEAVDLDALLQNSLNTVIQEAKKPGNAAQFPPMAALLLSRLSDSSPAGQGMRALLLGEMRAFVLNGIRSGAFAGKKTGGTEASGMLAPLFANASLGRKQIINIGKASRDGDDWLVPFSIYDHDNEQTYPLVGRLKTVDAQQKLWAIDNLPDLMRQVAAEAAN